MAEGVRAVFVACVLLLAGFSVLVFLPSPVAALSAGWTTDADFGAPGAIFVGTEVVGTGTAARVELLKDSIDWIDRDPTDPPGVREGPGLAFASDGSAFVLFGGYDGSDLDDTWEYDYASNAWTPYGPDPRPSGREFPGLSYDPVENVVVLFGGINATDGFLNDTWEYDVAAHAWSEQSPPTSPPITADRPLAYVASAARHVLVGQSLVNGAMVTWAYDAAAHTWTNLNPGSSPSARGGFATAYHAARDRLVLFGGAHFMTTYADTWEYVYGSSWSQVSASGPTARTGHAMTYRPQSQSVLLFGGMTPAGMSQETWRYTASAMWLAIGTGSRPSARQAMGLAYDPGADVAVLFGGVGASGDRLGDTWALQAAYRAAGKYAAAVYDSTAANVQWGTIWWNQTTADQPADTFLRFQVAAANAPEGPFGYVGPDGSPQTYYVDAGTPLWSGLDLRRYLRFLADYGSNDTSVSPSLEDLAILYEAPPDPPYLVSTDPPDATFGVPAGQTIYLIFSREVDPSSLDVTFLLGPAVPLAPTWSNGNSTVSLAHAVPFRENTVYRLLVAARTPLGVDLVAGPVPNPWVFTTEKVNPSVRNTNPREGDANVPEAQPVFVNFTEPMDTASVTVAITPDIALDRAWSNGNASLALTHAEPFAFCTHYTVELNGTDPSGLPLVPGDAAHPFTFLVRCRNPYVASASPVNREMGVPVGAPVVVDFSEPMNRTSVTFSIDPPVGGPSLAWSNGDTRLTMDHAAPFPRCVVHTVTVAGTDADEGLPLVPNPFQPFLYANPWKFMPACDNPFLFATRPEANATDVPASQEIWVVFSHGMAPESVSWTVTGGPFTERNTTWDVVMGAYVAVHIRHLGFRQCTRYTVELAGQDPAGNPLVPGFAPNPWSFDAECYSPYVTTTDPGNGTTQVPLDAPIVVRFSEPMNTSSVIVPIAPAVALDPAWSDGNTTLTLAHAANFTSCTRYDVFVDGLGADGNSLLVGEAAPAARDPWMFKSWCPGFYINRTEPADDRRGVPVDAAILVEFSRAADPATLQVTLSPPLVVTPAWSDNDTIVTLDHEAPFVECAWTTVTVSARAADGSDLVNTTVSVPNPWRFKTVCYPPTVLATSPPGGAIDVPLADPVVVDFSKPMDEASVNVTIAPTFPLVGTWTNNHTTLTLTHGPTFVPLQEYCVHVEGMDWQGNALIPGPAPNPWCFTTAAPLPAPRGLEVIRAPPDILLRWAPVPGATAYVVYGSEDRFAPWPWAQLGTTVLPSFIAAGHGTDGRTHFYIVRALVGPAVESKNSTVGAKVSLSFAFDGVQSNVYWLSLPYRSMYGSASDISDELTGARIDVVGKWDAALGRSLLWFYARGKWWGTDFILAPGDAFFLGVRADFTWAVNGTDGDAPLSLWGSPFAPVAHWVGLPSTTAYGKASDVVLDIEGSTGPEALTKILEVALWNGTRQRFQVFEWSPTGWRGMDFPIVPMDAVYLKVVSSFVWTPRLISPEVP